MRPVSTPAASPRATAVYRRRRAVAGVVVAVVLGASGSGVHGLLAGRGGVPASASTARPATREVHLVRPGDTIWEIAEVRRGGVAMSAYIDALIRANGGTTHLEPGQALTLP